MEFFKDCCKNLSQRNKKEQETQVIKLKGPPMERMVTEDVPNKRIWGKQPPSSSEIPFVVPPLTPSYVQPPDRQRSLLQPGLPGSARTIFAGQKAELIGNSFIPYNPESIFHQHSMYISDRRDAPKNNLLTPGWTPKSGKEQRRSSSTLDLTSPSGRTHRIDSISSTISSTSSTRDPMGSSLESVALSGDEQELGKVCVRIRYQQDVEQVWITLVQCSDLSVHPKEEQKIGFKGIITVPKPIQFKSSLKEYRQDATFMETFVFALRLKQLQGSNLMLRLQTHNPRTRVVADCLLSLRQLGSQESEHWLDLKQPSKSPACQSELHLSTVFQPVSGRIQVKVLAAQNLPLSSSPLSQVFYVKAEMQQLGQGGVVMKTQKQKASRGQCRWEETFSFLLASLERACTLTVRLYSRTSVRTKRCLGQVRLGFDSPLPGAVDQWKDTMAHPEKVVTAWHRLSPP